MMPLGSRQAKGTLLSANAGITFRCHIIVNIDTLVVYVCAIALEFLGNKLFYPLSNK